MQETEELHLWLRLMLTPGVGNLTARKLLARFGSPDGIFSSNLAAIQALCGEKLALALQSEPAELPQTWQRTLAWLAQSKQDGLARSLVCLGDAIYPADLLNIADPPCMLYLLGAPSHLQAHRSANSLAIVGSRNPSAQGAKTAQAFAHDLGKAGICVVSGMAHGIDAAAHAGALEAQGHLCPTIAVVGTGLDRVYPRQNQALARQIATNGLLISEYPVGTPPLASNFPKRNRLIAGLTRGTLVVEAALESGSLITAHQANEQGKDVFAIPGSIHGPYSRGCHALIREGATLVETVAHILEEWHWESNANSHARPDHKNLAAHPLLQLMGSDPIDLDTLQSRSGLPTDVLQAQLLELELEERIGRLPGQRFQIIGLS